MLYWNTSFVYITQVACVVDVHNHLRQGSLAMDDAITTHDWWFINFCTITDICDVDSFKL